MFTITTSQIATFMADLLLPFVRISAMFLAAPVYGATSMPIRVRILLAAAISVLLFPVLPSSPVADLVSPIGFLLVVQQIVIGVAMGFMLQMVFQMLVIAGEAMANSMGLGFARMVDPVNGVQVPVISTFLIVMSTLLFVSLNGHLLLINLLVESFTLLPADGSAMQVEGYWYLVSWGTQMFAGAVMVAIPAVTAMLVVNISMGVITRAAPTLNIFAVGFPLMILLGFVFFTLSLPSVMPAFTHMMMDTFDAAQNALVIGQPQK